MTFTRLASGDVHRVDTGRAIGITQKTLLAIIDADAALGGAGSRLRHRRLTALTLIVAHQIIRAIIDALLLVADRNLAQINLAFGDTGFAERITELPVGAVVETNALFVALALAYRRDIGHTVVAFGIADLVVRAVIDALLIRSDLAGKNIVPFDAVGAVLIAE